jgi:transcriptional/translational regulatory protein YebC/TACO1
MEVVTDAGAEDMNQDGDRFVVTCAPNDLNSVRSALEAAGLSVESAELSLEPTATVAVPDEADAKKVLRMLEAIDDHDDVQAVHANYDISDEVLAGFYA